jgi:TetR/AcrR family transcriptional regulator, fatty acid metabolism regulator protein
MLANEPQNRRSRERAQRSSEILAAARRVFVERGYARATMDDVARAAEFSKPTLYQYFENKDALFFSLTKPVVIELGAALDDAWARALAGTLRTGRELIAALFGAMRRAYAVDAEGLRLLQLVQQADLLGQMSEGVQLELDRLGRKNFQRGRQLLLWGMKKRLLVQQDPRPLLDVAWGSFVGVVSLEGIKQRGRPSKDHLERTLVLAESIFAAGVVK